MAPPALPCTVQGCEFATPAGLAAEQALQLLLLHRVDLHPDLPQAQRDGLPQVATQRTKADQ